MKKFTVAAFVFLAFLTACAPSVWADDPPEIIGILTCPMGDVTTFGAGFTSVGDQNGDGCDELLISLSRNDSLSRVYLFNGGERIQNEPSFTFIPSEDLDFIGRDMVYLGNVTPDIPPLFATISGVMAQRTHVVEFFTLGDHPIGDPSYTMRGIWYESTPKIVERMWDFPIDFNNDGYDDVVFVRLSEGLSYLQVLFGGEAFDTIPDWSVYLPNVPSNLSGGYNVSGGYDINGDGFDDMIVRTHEDANYEERIPSCHYFNLFLGGSPPDTVPAVRLRGYDMDLTEYFTIVPDMNGDGYAEWAINWNHIPMGPDDHSDPDAGFYIFLGSDEPDGEPDINLLGTPDPWNSNESLCAGDFNGDGYGDIVAHTGGSDEDHGQAAEIQYHFGNPWIADQEERREPDIFIDLRRAYGGEYAHDFQGICGGVGDYNGDGADEFIWTSYERILVFAGSRRWHAGVDDEVSPQNFKLTLSVAPNPFNSTTTIRYTAPPLGDCVLTVLDISGREIVRAVVPAGDGMYPWTAPESGVYIVCLVSDNYQTARKLVCVK